MSIVPVSMTSLQNLIEGEKFYRRDFNVVKQFIQNDNTVYSAVCRTYVNGLEADNYATETSSIVLEGVIPSHMDHYENTLHEQRLSYSMMLSTSKHVYTAYHTVS